MNLAIRQILPKPNPNPKPKPNYNSLFFFADM